MEYILETNNLTKIYGQKEAAKDVNLHIREGQIYGLLGLIAIVLGVLKRKRDGKGGITGIVIGVLVIILAFSMASMWSNAFKELHNKAVEYMPESLWASVSDETDAGMMGIINKLPTDEATLNKLVDEMNQLNKIIDEKKD